MAGKFVAKAESLLARKHPFRHGYRRDTFPKGTAFGGGGKVSGIAQRRPLGGTGERSETEGVLGQRRAPSQAHSAVLQKRRDVL